MLGLTAYFDESGDADDPKCRFMGMGGLCAPEAAWSKFEKQWQEILDDQCGGVWFHMKDFAANEGIFTDWKEPRRRKLMGSLMACIAEAKARPFGAVVSLDAYEYLLEAIPGAEDILGEPYFLCFQDVTRAAALMAMEHSWPFVEDGTEEQVAMIYARQERFGTIQGDPGESRDREQMGKAESLWYRVKEANPHFGKWMGSYACSTPKSLNFLQAADLFAYELVHEFENRINRPEDDMRWALAEMLPGSWRDFLHKFYGLPQLLDLLMDSNLINATGDQRSGGSINSSMSKIMHRDLLFARMYDRKRRNETT